MLRLKLISKLFLAVGLFSFALPTFRTLASFEPRGSEPTPAVTTQAPLPAPEEPLAQVSAKVIQVSLANQTLKYFEASSQIGEFKISSGLRGTPSPVGQFTILKKIPIVDYKGVNYDFPRTKWNLMFKKGTLGNYYIHGAYWHHNFGHPMSHGCINVAYENIEPLYNWADVGTRLEIE